MGVNPLGRFGVDRASLSQVYPFWKYPPALERETIDRG